MATPSKRARSNSTTPQDEEKQESIAKPEVSVSGGTAPASSQTGPLDEEIDTSTVMFETTTCTDTAEDNNFATVTLHTPDKTSIVKQFPSSNKLAEILAWIASDRDRKELYYEFLARSSEGHRMWLLQEIPRLTVYAEEFFADKELNKVADITVEELKLDGCEIWMEAAKPDRQRS